MPKNTHTAAALAIVQANKSLGAWPTKTAGAMPTAANFATAQAHGGKPGTNKWLALALMARKGGCTVAQQLAVLNGPHLNCWRAIAPTNKGQYKPKGSKHFAYTIQAKGAPKTPAPKAGKGKAAAKQA